MNYNKIAMDRRAKLAMDAAVEEGTKRGIESYQEMEEARKLVEPIIGSEAVKGAKSAAELYRTALSQGGIDVSDVDDSALKILFAHMLKNRKDGGATPAMDRAFRSAAVSRVQAAHGLDHRPMRNI